MGILIQILVFTFLKILKSKSDVTNFRYNFYQDSISYTRTFPAIE